MVNMPKLAASLHLSNFLHELGIEQKLKPYIDMFYDERAEQIFHELTFTPFVSFC